MSELTATGTIDAIYPEQQVTDRFKKQEFVLKIADNNPLYDQFVKFELHQDKTDLIAPFNMGDKAIVSFNLRGNKKDGKVWNSLQAWKIIKP